MHDWEFYPSGIMIDYEQSVDEGLISKNTKIYFLPCQNYPKMKSKKKLGDALFEIVFTHNFSETI